MGHLVIACYRPKPGQEQELLACVRGHLPTLRKEGLVTERPSLVLRAADGTLLEIFEWKSAAAVDQAHKNAAVLAMWGRFSAASEIVKLGDLEEASAMFAHFEPVAV